MSGLFPMFDLPQDQTAGLPLYRDVQMDYEKGCPVWAGGAPVFVTGLEAVRGWACPLPLVGQPYREDTKRSEAERYVREALLVSPYIREAKVTQTSFEGSTIRIAVDMTTVYGRTSVYV